MWVNLVGSAAPRRWLFCEVLKLNTRQYNSLDDDLQCMGGEFIFWSSLSVIVTVNVKYFAGSQRSVPRNDWVSCHRLTIYFSLITLHYDACVSLWRPAGYFAWPQPRRCTVSTEKTISVTIFVVRLLGVLRPSVNPTFRISKRNFITRYAYTMQSSVSPGNSEVGFYIIRTAMSFQRLIGKYIYKIWREPSRCGFV